GSVTEPVAIVSVVACCRRVSTCSASATVVVTGLEGAAAAKVVVEAAVVAAAAMPAPRACAGPLAGAGGAHTGAFRSGSRSRTGNSLSPMGRLVAVLMTGIHSQGTAAHPGLCR